MKEQIIQLIESSDSIPKYDIIYRILQHTYDAEKFGAISILLQTSRDVDDVELIYRLLQRF